MTPGLSAASPSRIGKRSIESLLGLNTQGKTHRITYMKLYSGTHLRPINGRVKGHLLLKV